jgi:geranylgeranyl pyrophosphate synthase
VAHYLAVLADKTGSLVATSARFGATFAGVDEALVGALTAFGEEVGVAFQLSDDLLDIVSPSEESGKSPGRTFGRASRRCPCCSSSPATTRPTRACGTWCPRR